MSRIGKLPIQIPAGVTVNIGTNNVVTVKGKLGTLTQDVDPDITLEMEGQTILVSRPTDHRRHRSMHGLYRALIHNMVHGVSQGYESRQEIVGVGYRATAAGQLLEMHLGYSHPIIFQIPQEVKLEVIAEKKSNNIIVLRSYDKQLLGQVAAKIRSLRKPEPYKGKGIKFVGEVLRKKAGKAASSK